MSSIKPPTPTSKLASPRATLSSSSSSSRVPPASPSFRPPSRSSSSSSVSIPRSPSAVKTTPTRLNAQRTPTRPTTPSVKTTPTRSTPTRTTRVVASPKKASPAKKEDTFTFKPFQEYDIVGKAFSPAPNNRIWCASKDGTVHIIDSQKGEVVGILEGPTDRQSEKPERLEILSLLMVEDQMWSGGADGIIRIWNPETGAIVGEAQGHSAGVCSMILLQAQVPYDIVIYSAAQDWTIRMWDKYGHMLKLLLGHTNWVRTLVWCPETNRLWSGGEDSILRVWNEETGTVEKELKGHTGGISSLLIVNDKVWSGSGDGSIRVWNLYDMTPVVDAQGNEVILKGHTGYISGLLLAGDQVYSGSTDKTLRIWTTRGRAIRTIALEGYVSEMQLIQYNIWLATGDKKVRVYSPFEDETKRRLKAEDQLKEERLLSRKAELQRMLEEKRLRAELEEERRHMELERERERKTKDDLIQNYLEQIAELKRRLLELTEKNAELKMAFDGMTDQMKRMELKYQVQIDELLIKLRDTEQKLLCCNNDLSACTETLQKAKQSSSIEIAIAKSREEEARKTLELLSKEKSSSTDSFSFLETQLQEEQAKVITLESKIRELEVLLVTKKDEAERQEHERNRMNAALKAAEQNFQSFQLQLLSKQKDLESQLHDVNETIVKEIEEKNAATRKLQLAEEQWKSQEEEYLSKIRDFEVQLATQQKLIESEMSEKQQQDIEKQIAEQKALQQQLSAAEQKAKALEEQLVAKQKEFEANFAALQEAFEAQRIRDHEAFKRQQEQSEQNEELLNELESKQEEIQTLIENNSALEAELERMKQSEIEMHKVSLQKEQELLNIQHELESKLQVQKNELDTEIASKSLLIAQQQELEAKLQEYREECEKAQVQRMILEESMKANETTGMDLEANYSKRFEEMASKHAEQYAKLQAYENQIQQYEDEKKRMISLLQDAEKKLEELKSQLIAKCTELESSNGHDKTIEELTAKIEQQTSELENNSTIIRSLEEQLKAKKEESLGVNNELMQLQRQLESKELALRQSTIELEAKEAEILVLKEQAANPTVIIEKIENKMRIEKEEAIKEVQTEHRANITAVDEHYRETIESLMQQLKSQSDDFHALLNWLLNEERKMERKSVGSTEVSGVLKAGFMMKKGKVVKGWRQRLFLLKTSGDILYFSDTKAPRPRGVINLREAMGFKLYKEPMTAIDMPNVLEVQTPNRVWTLQFTNEQIMYGWLDAMKNFTDKYKEQFNSALKSTRTEPGKLYGTLMPSAYANSAPIPTPSTKLPAFLQHNTPSPAPNLSIPLGSTPISESPVLPSPIITEREEQTTKPNNNRLSIGNKRLSSISSSPSPPTPSPPSAQPIPIPTSATNPTVLNTPQQQSWTNSVPSQQPSQQPQPTQPSQSQPSQQPQPSVHPIQYKQPATSFIPAHPNQPKQPPPQPQSFFDTLFAPKQPQQQTPPQQQTTQPQQPQSTLKSFFGFN